MSNGNDDQGKTFVLRKAVNKADEKTIVDRQVDETVVESKGADVQPVEDASAASQADSDAGVPRTTLWRGGDSPTPAAGDTPVGSGSVQQDAQAEPAQTGQVPNNPVVGWLVVVGGPGYGGFRPIFEGRNKIGRLSSLDIPLDFGDNGISKQQAIIHYDPRDRKFLFIPELDVENFAYINDAKPTTPMELSASDLVEIAATKLRFVPLCGEDFDWSENAPK